MASYPDQFPSLQTGQGGGLLSQRKSSSLVFLGAAGALAASVAVNVWLANKAERDDPPIGRFVQVDGTRVHYVERGSGDPLVLLHGNGSMVEDFIFSGLMDRSAQAFRVFAFDRPGFGHSERPRTKVWDPQAQARLLYDALQKLDIGHAIVFAHSWGTAVALELEILHPEFVDGLVLASGYYYPSARADVLLFGPPALPLVGDAVRFTVSP